MLKVYDFEFPDGGARLVYRFRILKGKCPLSHGRVCVDMHFSCVFQLIREVCTYTVVFPLRDVS